ncbi:MAG: CRISPR-associated endoribonuclease Cas6 [Catalinimonas sp.]
MPFHHQHILADFIHEALNRVDNHDANPPLSFSGLKGQTKVSRTGLCFFSSKVTLVLTSPSEELVTDCLKGIFAQNRCTLGELQLVPEQAAQEQPVTFDQPSAKFICISPMVLLGPQHEGQLKRFVSPETDDFSDLLYESTMARMEASGRFSSEDIASFYKFQVVPDHQYLSKVRSEEKKFARIYPVFPDGRKVEVRGYTMPFTLFAQPAVQQFVFECGLGEMTQRGFGMLDLANSQPHKRARPLMMPELVGMNGGAAAPRASTYRTRRNVE